MDTVGESKKEIGDKQDDDNTQETGALKYVFESEDEVISLPPDRDAFYDSLKDQYLDELQKKTVVKNPAKAG